MPPKRPVSPKRLAANRANAVRSCGPRSPEGKARAAQNARKHDFNPDPFAAVRLENPEAIANLRADAIAFYRPVNAQELSAVERIAIAQHSLLRVAALEAGVFTNFLDEEMRQSTAITVFLRRQAQTDREYRRAIEDFERLKALRSELPGESHDAPNEPKNEPIAASQPEETKPVHTPQTKNSQSPGPQAVAPVRVIPSPAQPPLRRPSRPPV
jgi:hypothetical protein